MNDSLLPPPILLFVENPEQVLDLEQVSGADDENRAGSRDRKWSVQRIRLSPAEKHLAATLKANDRDEPR